MRTLVRSRRTAALGRLDSSSKVTERVEHVFCFWSFKIMRMYCYSMSTPCCRVFSPCNIRSRDGAGHC